MTGGVVSTTEKLNDEALTAPRVSVATSVTASPRDISRRTLPFAIIFTRAGAGSLARCKRTMCQSLNPQFHR